MKRFTLAATALAVLAAFTPAAAQTPPGPTLSVTGRGIVDRMPDQAIVTFAIVTNDDNAGHATSTNNAAYNALVEHLGRLGLGPSAIKTTGFDVAFNPRPPQPNPQAGQRYGYVVTRNASVTTARTDQVGAVIDAGVTAGITDVGGISFGLRDDRGAYRGALAAAVADAQDQARALAGAAHVRLGRIERIEPSRVLVPMQMANGPFARTAAPVPTEVQPSNLSVQAKVSVTYQIVP